MDLSVAFVHAGLWAVLAASRATLDLHAAEVDATRDRFYAAAVHQRSSLQALMSEVRETLKAVSTTVHHTASLHPMNPALNLHHARVVAAVETSLGNVRHLADLLTRMHDVDADEFGLHAMEWGPRHTEFDLASVAENIGDALSGVADEKGLELVVSCPVERGRQHLYLVVGDKELMTQILFKLLGSALELAQADTRVELNLRTSPPRLARDSPTEGPGTAADKSPSLSSARAGADAPSGSAPAPPTPLSNQFLTTVTFQIVFNPDPTLEDRVSEVGAAITDVLVEFVGGRLERAVRTDNSTIELECEMEVVQREVPAAGKDFGRKEDPLVQPTPEELLGFAGVLEGFRVALLTPSHSQFTQNLTQYLENLGTDLTYLATNSVSEINKQLDVFDNRATVTSSGLRGTARERRMQSAILVDDDFSLLDAAIQHRADSKSQSVVVCFASPSHELRAYEFLQSTEAAQSSLAGRILVVTKPVGPRKLLAALRHVLGNLGEAQAPQSDDEEEGRAVSSLARRKKEGEVAKARCGRPSTC
ncbi:hypothetical protein DFJ74DRAFT_396015 [Hyaloraphidium curvatum]|nr:hypothetical protein DFJ74DRAFT_396015 [Hyaloraphidium curvatum]